MGLLGELTILDDEHTLHMKDKICCISSVRYTETYDFILVGTESQVILIQIYSFSRLSTPCKP